MKRLLAVCLFAATSALAAEPINVHGALLPPDAQKVGENRYRTSDDYEATLKFYRTVYPQGQFPRKAIVNQPGVKATHIAIPGSRSVEGLNIYQANDEVRIFIVPADARPKKKATPKKS